jgi:transcriptional regulator with XRE-family HTH domain
MYLCESTDARIFLSEDIRQEMRTPMTMQEMFSQDLRSARERRGVTLEDIARSTKVRRPLLTALEAGEVSKLPDSIYARGMLRGYAAAVGLSPQPLLAQLSQLYAERDATAGAHPASSGMRLTLAPEPRWNPRAVCNMLAAVSDTCTVLLIAGVIGQLSGANQWLIGGPVALAYYAAATGLIGRSPASWYVARMESTLQRKMSYETVSVQS